MLRLTFGEYKIELADESLYSPAADTISKYDFVYQDQESELCRSTGHGIKIFKDDELRKSAVVRAVGGATGIHENSAVIVDEDILICCADKVFCLSLPDLRLNWMKQIDDATCFQIFNTRNGIFVHGEMCASRIDKTGNIIWSQGFADILVTPDGKNEFIIREDFIEIEDWNHDKYKLNFDGEFI